MNCVLYTHNCEPTFVHPRCIYKFLPSEYSRELENKQSTTKHNILMFSQVGWFLRHSRIGEVKCKGDYGTGKRKALALGLSITPFIAG